MIDTERKRINKQGRSATTIHGVPSIIFGMPFFCIGAFIIMISTGVIRVDEASFNAPKWVVGAVGAIFGFAGLSLIVHGIKGIFRKKRREKLSAFRPGEPWHADYLWNEREVGDEALRKVVKAFIMAFVFSLFMVPFCFFIFVKGDDVPFFAKCIFSIFLAIPGGVAIWAFYMLARYIKYGSSHLAFEHFPFFLGETLDAALFTKRGIGSFDSIEIKLRCVEEKYEMSGTGKNRSEKVVCYQVYAETIRYEDPGSYDASSPALPISFTIPQDGRPTTLAERPPVFSEFAVTDATPESDVKSTFLVPVYAKS